MNRMTEPVLISRVTRDGQVERLGVWHHEHRSLELERDGFPFLGPGRHVIEGELPWIFWDMCPSGYLGRRLQRIYPALRLSPNPRDWSAADVLRTLESAGADLAGNLLVGETAVSAFLAHAPREHDLRGSLDAVLSDSVNVGLPSSLGGERPKLVVEGLDGGAIVKFSPPLTSTQGQRWSDLLRMEALCARTLHANGVSAPHSGAEALFERTLLFVRRFDRLPRRGRVGTGSLYWLAMDRYGDINLSAPEVMRLLATEGLVSAADAETCRQVHAFSAAIGNNDAHLGNYALLFDDLGRASLAPIYDVLPMALAPRNDELPDAYLQPLVAPVDPAVVTWVEALIASVEADAEISSEFKTLWRRYIGR